MLKHVALAVISAVFFLLGVHPADQTWLSCLAFLPLFMIVFDPAVRWRAVLALTALTSVVVYSIGLYWLVLYSVQIYLLVLLMTASLLPLYFVLYFLIIRRCPLTAVRVLAAAALWLALQWLLSLTPFGTAAFDFPFYVTMPILQAASLVPFYCVGAVFVGMTSAAALFLQRRNLTTLLWAAVFSLIITTLSIYGRAHLDSPVPPSENPWPRVAIIQHNLPISGIWRLEHPEKVKARYRSLALEAARRKPELIVFPLYTMPFDALREPDFFLSLARETNCHILAASHIPRKAGKSMLDVGRFDIAILYSPAGKVVGHHIATQGPPLRDIGEETAKRYHLIDSPIGRLGILLCYEDATPQVARTARREGAEYLVALSNPGHFQNTHLPFYHLMADRFRAIETGLPLLRASTNGYSAIVDSRGRVIRRSALSEETILFI